MIALELTRSYPSAGLETVAEFARRAGTSSPSVLRFIAKIGFRSYAEFQSRLRAEVAEVLQSPLTRASSLPLAGAGGSDGDFGTVMRNNIARSVDMLGAVDLSAVAELVSDEKRKLFLIGGRFSKANALWTYQLLRELRGNIRLVDEAPANYAEHLVDMGRTAVVIAFDYRRYQDDVVAFVAAARRRGASIVAVTDEWQSPIASSARYVFTTPVAVPSLFDSTIGSLVQMEALVARVAETLGPRAATRIAAIEQARDDYDASLDAEPRGDDPPNSATRSCVVVRRQ